MMRFTEEKILDDKDMALRLKGEREPVTLRPFRTGDRVVRCRKCGRLVLKEHISHCCPLCGASPFRPAPYDRKRKRLIERTPSNLTALFYIFSSVPVIAFIFPSVREGVLSALPGFSCTELICATLFVSLVISSLLEDDPGIALIWEDYRIAALLPLIPAVVPCPLIFLLYRTYTLIKESPTHFLVSITIVAVGTFSYVLNELTKGERS